MRESCTERSAQTSCTQRIAQSELHRAHCKERVTKSERESIPEKRERESELGSFTATFGNWGGVAASVEQRVAMAAGLGQTINKLLDLCRAHPDVLTLSSTHLSMSLLCTLDCCSEIKVVVLDDGL